MVSSWLRNWEEAGQRSLALYVFGELDFGNVFAGGGAQFAADEVGGEAEAQQAAEERGHFFVVNFAASQAQFALDALANCCGFIGLFAGVFKGGGDVTIRHASRTQVTRYPELSLFAVCGTLMGELFSVARIVDLAIFA